MEEQLVSLLAEGSLGAYTRRYCKASPVLPEHCAARINCSLRPWLPTGERAGTSRPRPLGPPDAMQEAQAGTLPGGFR